MYLEHFGLTEDPFSTVPDPRFYYPSVKHREALACLVYAIQNHKGVALITGDIGTGKTMLCRSVLNQIEGDTEVALLDYTLLAPDEFHQAVCKSFDLSPDGTKFELRRRLGEYAEDQQVRGTDVVLIVDEAQNLSQEVLEELRSLSNLATPTHKLLQIILLGQPEFRGRISAPGMEALNQRITLKFHLGPLSLEDTKAYIGHRLKKAGAENDAIFDEEAKETVHDATNGVPRLVNVLCDQALLMAYARDESTITAEIVEETAEDREGFYCEDDRDGIAWQKAPAASEIPAENDTAHSEELKEHYNRLLQQSKDLERRLRREQQRADRLGERVDTLEGKLAGYSDKVDELQTLKREREDELATRQRKIEGLEQKLEEAGKAKTRQKELRKELEGLQGKVEKYLQQIDELETLEREQKDELAARNRTIENLEQQLKSFQDTDTQQDQLRETVDELQEQVDEYAQRIEELEALRHEHEEELAAKSQKVEELEQQLVASEDAGDQEEKLRGELDNLQDKVENYLEQIEELEQEKREQSEALARHEQKVSELKQQLTETEDQSPEDARFREKVEKLQNKVDQGRNRRREIANQLFEAGERALDAGHGGEARAMLQAAVELGIDSPLAHYRLGSSLFQTGQYEKAIEHYKNAISTLESNGDPDHILLLKAYNNCGVALARLQQLESALEMYEKAIGPDEDYASPYLNLGLLHRDQMGDDEAAIKAFRRYIELDGRRSEQAERAIEELKSGKPTA